MKSNPIEFKEDYAQYNIYFIINNNGLKQG